MLKLGTMLLIPLAACSAGNAETGEAVDARGRGPSRDYDVAGFTAVSLRGTDDVDVRVGPAFSVRAQGPADQLDRLEILREGDALVVRRKRSMGWTDSKGVKVFVTMPRIAAASIAGTGDMTVDRVAGARFRGAVSGTGSLALPAVRVDEAELSVSGTGDLTAAGVVRRLALSLSGTGDIDARAVAASEATASLAGTGDIRATVDGPVAVTMAGMGDVEIGGSPRCTISKAGLGDVRCG